MKGIVDESGRTILPVQILCPKHQTGVQVDVWIDTGFTGDLVLPESLIEDLELEVTGSIDGVLADGSQVELSMYHCQLKWFARVVYSQQPWRTQPMASLPKRSTPVPRSVREPESYTSA